MISSRCARRLAEIAAEPAHLYQPAVAYRARGGRGFGAPGEKRRTENPPNGAVIDYYLSSVPPLPISMQISDSKGEIVQRAVSGAEERGEGGERGGGPGPLAGRACPLTWD